MEWADRVIYGHIIKGDARHYYQTLLKNMKRPLVATTMTKNQQTYAESFKIP